jgi:hypothetical protein
MGRKVRSDGAVMYYPYFLGIYGFGYVGWASFLGVHEILVGRNSWWPDCVILDLLTGYATHVHHCIADNGS